MVESSWFGLSSSQRIMGVVMNITLGGNAEAYRKRYAGPVILSMCRGARLQKVPSLSML